MFVQIIAFGIISIILSTKLTPRIIKFGLEKGFIDNKKSALNNSTSKVRIGGIAIYLGQIVTLYLAFILTTDLSNSDLNLLFVSSTSLIFFIGLFDDILSLSALFRLIVQLSIASFVYFYGININQDYFLIFANNNNNFFNPYLLSFVFTTIWLIGTTNAINWLDGLDGLASGFTITCSVVLGIINLINNNIYGLLLSVIILGSTLGFLKYNFYPSKVLMGDCGSNFIGFYLALLALITFKIDSLKTLACMLILFSVPILDMFKVIIFRFIDGKNPLKGDDSHLHYRLLNNGISHKNSVIILYFLFVITSTLSYALYKFIRA